MGLSDKLMGGHGVVLNDASNGTMRLFIRHSNEVRPSPTPGPAEGTVAHDFVARDGGGGTLPVRD
jgi:hypothetical protein